jgi:hypothetical protein
LFILIYWFVVRLIKNSKILFPLWLWVIIPEWAMKNHALVMAGSGSGKSEFLKCLIFSRVWRHQATCILDPHGDMAAQVARWTEWAGRGRKRLVLIDPFLNP